MAKVFTGIKTGSITYSTHLSGADFNHVVHLNSVGPPRNEVN
ncbi:16749_t:CDS:2, partial [Funneliformis geosporum]